MKKYKIAILVLIVVLYIIIANIYSTNSGREHFMQFNTVNINGELENVDYANHGIGFKIKGSETKYVFYPYTNLVEKKVFENIAEKGDSILKIPYSDTLKLIKKNKVYLYTFQKFN